jgi:hypothetical protein
MIPVFWKSPVKKWLLYSFLATIPLLILFLSVFRTDIIIFAIEGLRSYEKKLVLAKKLETQIGSRRDDIILNFFMNEYLSLENKQSTSGTFSMEELKAKDRYRIIVTESLGNAQFRCSKEDLILKHIRNSTIEDRLVLLRLLMDGSHPAYIEFLKKECGSISTYHHDLISALESVEDVSQ